MRRWSIMNETVLNRIAKALINGSRVFIIRGAAGTGKTTLIQSLIPILKTRGFDIRLMAPTGRAALILHKRTGYDASTIHSCIFNIKDEPIKDERGDALKWIFPLKADRDDENQAFIVDEASMVGIARHESDRELFQFGSGSLLNDLIQYSGIRTERTTNLLFFVGDVFQLPPVGERCELPPALDARKLEELTGVKPTVIELETVHRQREGSGILLEAMKLRDALSRKDFSRLAFSEHNDLRIIEVDQLCKELNPKQELDSKIIIAQTNVRVREYNDEVRGCLEYYNNGHPMKGERLLCIKNSQVLLKDGTKAQFFNGDFLRVLDVHGTPISIEGHYRPKGSEDVFSYTYTFIRMSIEWTYEAERGKVEDILVNITPILLPAWDENDGYASIGLYNGVKDHIEEQLRKKFPDFRKDRSKKRYWDDMVRKMIQDSDLLRAPIVKFGYAVTGHKSQGGEWDFVWADYAFSSNQMSSYFFRWAYTVTTRARRCLYVASMPRIDALSSAFDNVVNTKDTNENGGGIVIEESALAKALKQFGLKISKVEPLSFRDRVIVVNQNGISNGYVDFIYRNNQKISNVDIHIPECDGALNVHLEMFKGCSVQMIRGHSQQTSETDVSAVPIIDVRPAYIPTIERIVTATEGGLLRLLSARSLTDYQVRMTFLFDDKGEGWLDLHFNKRGRITLGASTLDDQCMTILKQCIS